jgi:alpha-beta hydrolase superfamily lysophospholipase
MDLMAPREGLTTLGRDSDSEPVLSRRDLARPPRTAVAEVDRDAHDSVGHDAGGKDSDSDAARMRPLVFDGCFGWLHTAADMAGGDTAVLLCPGLSRDALNGHRSYRVLANRLAAHGYPTLRFDYPGAGDSRDADTAEHWAVWQASIHAACDLLRASSGARRVVLCGLRLGAALAAEIAADREDVAGLVLLAPVVRGKAYVRQLLIEARLREFASEATDGGIELDELRLSAETVARISETELRKIRLPPDCKVAIFEQPRSGALSECVQAWTARGVEVFCDDAANLAALVRPSYLNDEPEADFSGVLGWLRDNVPPAPARPARLTPLEPDAALHLPGCIETPLRFGADGHLFGVLCRPSGAEAGDLAVVIGNTGGDPHYGFARFSVGLARFLAAAGIASLRMDFTGLGDSTGPAGQPDVASHIFDVDRAPDFDAAIDALTRAGYRRFAAMGLCSGAYHAFHAGLRDRRLGALVLLNMPLFTWRQGDSIEFVSRKIARTPRYYLTAIVRAEVWARLLRGETDVIGIVKSQAARYGERCGELVRRVAHGLGWEGPPGFARRAMQTLSGYGTRTLFLLAQPDAGVAELEKHFGPGGIGLAQLPGATARIEPGLDHMLTSAPMRRAAGEIILAFLRELPSSTIGRP